MTEREPLFGVVKGHPTEDEATALALVLAAKIAARGAGRDLRDPAGASPRGGWAGHARALRIAPAPGPGAWRRSALPG